MDFISNIKEQRSRRYDTDGKQNSVCCQIDVSQPVALGLIYGGPQILVNVTYVLPYMEKAVQVVTFSFSLINQFVLSITVCFAQKLSCDYCSFHYISIRTSRQLEQFHAPWYTTVNWNADCGL